MAGPIRKTTLTWEQVEKNWHKEDFKDNCHSAVMAVRAASQCEMAIDAIFFLVMAGLGIYFMVYGGQWRDPYETFYVGVFLLALAVPLLSCRVYKYHQNKKRIESDKATPGSPYLASLLEGERSYFHYKIAQMERLRERCDCISRFIPSKESYAANLKYLEGLRA